MEIPATIGLLSVIVLVLANGFFVATEFAIVAVRRSRLDQLAQDGSRGGAGGGGPGGGGAGPGGGRGPRGGGGGKLG
jgi:hypothetical protein